MKTYKNGAYKKLKPEQRKWLRENFADTKNEDIADHLGVSMSTVARMSRYIGLKKSDEFIETMQREHILMAQAKSRIHNYYAKKGFCYPGSEKGWFKPGMNNLMRNGAENEANRVAKSKATRNNTIKAERRRVLFGLPQRTKMRFVHNSREMINERYYLKKRGYILDEDNRIAYYNDSTQRGPVIEKRYTRYEFKYINNGTVKESN